MFREKDESHVFQAKTNRKRIFEYLEEHPTMSNEGLYFQFSNVNESTIRVYKSEFRRRRRFERVKPAIWILFDVFNYKCTLNSKLSKAEKIAMEFLERWSGYKDYKEEVIMEAAEKLRGKR